MRAGELRKRFTVEQPAEAADCLCQMVQTWSTFAVLWGELHPLVGTERIQAAQINANADTQITVRYFAGITNKMRIRYGARIFQIVSALNVDERNREIDLLCTEHLA